MAKPEYEIMKNWDMTQTIPKVSICSITFNHENYIAQTIESLLEQVTNFPFEIVIRDDASTDKTASIIMQYVQNYPKIIKPIYEEHNGFSNGIKPLAVVINAAQGKYIAICEGDDYWTDNVKLQTQVDFLDQNPDFVITYHDCQPFDENGEIEADLGGAKRDLEAIELQKSTPIYTLTTCFRNVFKTYPKEDFCSPFGDLFLWSILGNYGKGKYLPYIKPAMYRMHSGGIFSKKTKKEKYEMALLTDASLFAYYSRIKNEELKIFYKEKMLSSWILSEKYSRFVNFAYNYQKKRWHKKIISKIKKYKQKIRSIVK